MINFTFYFATELLSAVKFICYDSTLRWLSQTGSLGMSGGKTPKEHVFQPVFSHHCLFRREKGKEIGGESKLEALMGMWWLKRKGPVQDKQVSIYRGRDFFHWLRIGCPCGHLLLPDESSTPPKRSALQLLMLLTGPLLPALAGFHSIPKLFVREAGLTARETPHSPGERPSSGQGQGHVHSSLYPQSHAHF